MLETITTGLSYLVPCLGGIAVLAVPLVNNKIANTNKLMTDREYNKKVETEAWQRIIAESENVWKLKKEQAELVLAQNADRRSEEELKLKQNADRRSEKLAKDTERRSEQAERRAQEVHDFTLNFRVD